MIGFLAKEIIWKNLRLIAITTVLLCNFISFYAVCAQNITQGTNVQLKYFIIVTGGELLKGYYPDAHTAYITRTLQPLGYSCVGSIIVDDQADDIIEALRFATNKASLIITTGGLGPTANDITRETLSKFTGIKLAEHPAILAEFEKRFNTPRDKLRQNIVKQAMIPVKGTYLKNAIGTSYGLVFELDSNTIVALPGPPSELQRIVKDELVPYLTKKYGTRPIGSSITLRFIGVGQSQIDALLREHGYVPEDVIETSLFENGRVDFTFSLPGNSKSDFEKLKQIIEKIRPHLSEYIYSEDGSTLEQVIARQLTALKHNIAIAEIATGGALIKQMNTAKELSSRINCGFVAQDYAKLQKITGLITKLQDGLDDRKKVEAIAFSIQKQTSSDWTLCIGETSFTKQPYSVNVAFIGPEGFLEVYQFSLRDDSENSKALFVTQVLDRFRKCLKKVVKG